MDNWIYYIIILLGIIIAGYAIKKVASCMLKTILFLILLAALCYGFFLI